MQRVIQDFSIPAVFAGFITFLIGISVSAILVIQGAQSLGANTAQISSWFWALGLAIGLSGLILSWKYKYPVATAWSTPGIALIIASTGHYCGIAIALVGFSGIFQKLLAHIPQSLTCAMLAGILLKFGIQIFSSLETHLGFILSMLIIYLVSKRLFPRYSIVFTVILGAAICPLFIDFKLQAISWSLTQPIWMQPSFSWSAILGLALPLFVINMTSQNLPGIAMIKSYGYHPHVNQLVGWTGVAHTIFAPFGCFSVNLAAISAAVSLDDQVHPDPSKRYIAGISCGIFYILMGIFAATLVSLLMSFPQIFIVALAGIALFATISHNIAVAFSNVEEREAALLTFLCSASGIQFWGIGSAFWGLILGIFVLILFKFKLKNKP